MRTIHHIIIATLFLTNLFGVIPNKKMRQEDDLGNTSNQFANSRVVTSHSYFNGNEWYARVVNDGQWATDVPAGGAGGLWPRGSNNSVLYDAGLWIGFKDDQDEVHFSGVQYSSDFTPGPYGVTDSDNENYRVYKVNRWDDATVSDWSDWPADMGAPWEDNNSDGSYDPAVDQPYLPLDQTLYSVYNDSTDHPVFGTSINGIEVHQTIFGGVSAAHNDLSRTFFIKYEIINKGSLSWQNARFGPFIDVDLGDWSNDVIGVDVDSNMVYCYSKHAGDETDVFGISPAVGFRYISSVNSLDDTLSSGGCIGNDCGNGVGGNFNIPNNANEAYNRMLGLDNDGNNIYGLDGQELRFVHPGDPVSGTGWLDELVGDRQMFFSVAPSQLIEPGDTVGFVMAVIIAQGTDNLNSITELRDASYEAKTLWDSNFNGVSYVNRPILESGEDYGLFSDFTMPPVGPGNTVQLERTYHNGGNEILNISPSSDADGYSVDPASVAISPGDNASLTFLYTADNYTTTVHQVPSEISTIQGAVDAAMQTIFNAVIELIDDDNYNTQSYDADYSYTGDTILVAPGTYTENIYIDNKSIYLIATDGDPASTIIDGGNNEIVITVDNDGNGFFTLDGFTIQNGQGNYVGGGILFEYDFVGVVNIKNNIIKDNSADQLGGGLYSWWATGSVSRNIFINNSTNGNLGNAARLNAGGINFYNNTLWKNESSSPGAPLYVRFSDHRIINNIIWDNESNDSEYIVVNDINDSPTVEYNIVKNGYDGTGNISDDPQFYDADNWDFRLTASSPAIDAGDPDLDNDGEDYETDGDDQDPDGTRMDMGADPYLMLLNGSFEDGMDFWDTWNVNENISIETTGNNIYNSSAIFEAYNGEQALKMWGAYNDNETYTWVGQWLEVGPGGLEIGSLIMLDGMMMSHADDWIGQGASYSCLALYFYDADMTTYVGGQYSALSEFVDASAPSSEWLYRNVIAEVPTGTVWAWAGVEYYQPSNDDHGSVYIDMVATDYDLTDIFVDISFNFDMKNKNPDETGVYVAGSFNGWSTSDTQLFDDDGDEVYSVTLNLQGGSTIDYKFLNGNYWGESGEQHDVVNDPVCGTGDDGNRFYNVPYENAEIAPVCMNSCEDCTEDMNYDLADNWSVVTSFTREDVGEIFSQIEYNGRTVIGGMDLDEDGLKEIILTDYAGHRVLVYEYLTSDGSFEQVWSSPIIDNTNHDNSPRTVGVGDLDGDSKQEIVFPVSATGQEGWYIFEWNGVVGSDDYGDTYSSINSVELDVCCIDDASVFRGDHERTTIDDIDGDGQQELVIMIRRGNTRGTLITSVTGDIVHNAGGSGSEVWASEGFVNSDDYGGGSPYHSLPADLDGDGTVELVNHTWQNFNFYNIDVTGADTYVAATPGSDDSHYQASQYDNVSLFGGAAADIDNDGNEECFFPVYIIDGGEGDEGGLYLIDYDENDDILQINGNHVHKIVESETSLLYASIFDINGSQSPNIFTGLFDGKAIEIMSTEYLGGSLTSTGSYNTQNIFSLEGIYNVTVYDSAGVITDIDTSYSGYLSKVQSNINGLPIDFDDDGYKELLVSTSGMMSSYTVLTLTWNGSDWDETSSETIENMLHPVVSLIEYQGYQYPDIISSVASVSAVHGDTVLVEIELGIFSESLQSLDMSFSGFQDKLIFHDIVTDGYMFGNLGWFTQVNNTDELLITASAGANLITGNGVIFALELIVPDTLSTQFVPIVISDLLGNTDIVDGTFSDGGVEVVWEPTANFISDTTTGYLPLVISFTDTSEIGTYPVNQWTWNFGDDSTATGADVQHTYTQEGQYTVTLTVTDEFGLSDTLVMDDYIDALHPIYPVAGFSTSVTSGDYPLSVTFTDTSNMGTYEINNWLWDFGNDSTGSGSSVSMSYQRPGEFDVTLTITDEYGLSDTLIASSFIQVDTTFGDVDWNTAVQSFDASLILQDLVELIELDSLQMLIGDVSGDSSLSTLDATLILQYVVGLIDELPYIPDNQYLATGDLTMSDQGADPDMEIEIPIHISNGSNIYGFTGTINYDHTILNYDTLLFSDYLEGYHVAFNELSPGEIKIAASGNNPDGETGVFATIVFYVTDAFTDETSISITDLTWNEGEMIEVAAEMSITYGLGIDGVSIPDVYALHQNYPNPFNPTTQIKYDLPEDAMVSITIYDIMGRSIRSLVNSKQTAGYRSIQWNATNSLGEPVSAGMYIYMIQAGDFIQTKKMVLLK